MSEDIEYRQSLAFLLCAEENEKKFASYAEKPIKEIGGYPIFRWCIEEVRASLISGKKHDWIEGCCIKLAKVLVEIQCSFGNTEVKELLETLSNESVQFKTIKRFYDC